METATLSPTKTKVLYIDDEAFNLQSFKSAFRRSFDVLTASSAEEGKKILKDQFDIQVVISDQRMPGMTGVELLQEVKDQYPDHIRMLLTGYSDQEAMLDAINKAKVFYYFNKPWDEEEIKQKIAEAIAETKGYAQTELNDPQHEELDDLLKEYSYLWESWVNRSTLLSAKEVLAVEYFKNHRNHEVLAHELGVPATSVYNTYRKAMHKLKSNLNTYNTWIMARALELQSRKKGTPSQLEASEAPISNRFLRTSFKELGLSPALVRVLNSIECYKPEDVVGKYTVAQLATVRNFGQKKLDELVELFRENNCAHLV